MTKREKLRRKLRDHPANSSMQDVQTALEHFGFTLARTRGSHYIFEYAEGDAFAQIVIPTHGRKVKKAYVQKVVELLDKMFPPGMEAGEDDGEAQVT